MTTVDLQKIHESLPFLDQMVQRRMYYLDDLKAAGATDLQLLRVGVKFIKKTPQKDENGYAVYSEPKEDILDALDNGTLKQMLRQRRYVLTDYYASGVEYEDLLSAGVKKSEPEERIVTCNRGFPLMPPVNTRKKERKQYNVTQIQKKERHESFVCQRQQNVEKLKQNRQKKSEKKRIENTEEKYRAGPMQPGGTWSKADRDYLKRQMDKHSNFKVLNYSGTMEKKRLNKLAFDNLIEDDEKYLYHYDVMDRRKTTPDALRHCQHELDAYIEKTTGKRKQACPVEKPFGTDHVKEIVERVNQLNDYMKDDFFTNHTKTCDLMQTRIYTFLETESLYVDQYGDGDDGCDLKNMTEAQYKELCPIASSIKLVLTYLETYERAKNINKKMKDHLSQYYPVHPEWTKDDASMNPRDENGILKYPDGLPADREGYDRMRREMDDVAVQWKEYACLYDNHPENWINLLESKPNAQEFVNEFKRLYENFERCTTRDGKRIIEANKPAKRKRGRPRNERPPDKTDPQGRTRRGHKETGVIPIELPYKRQKKSKGKKKKKQIESGTTAADLEEYAKNGKSIPFSGDIMRGGTIRELNPENGFEDFKTGEVFAGDGSDEANGLFDVSESYHDGSNEANGSYDFSDSDDEGCLNLKWNDPI